MSRGSRAVFGIETAKPIGLQPVGHDLEHQVTRQVQARSAVIVSHRARGSPC